jgi:dihydroorotase
VVCSDHAPIDDDAKQLPFGEAEPGVTALELLLPLSLKWARESGFTMAQAIQRLTSNPATVLGRDAGQLGIGAQADICIFQPNRVWTVNAKNLFSQGCNTPYFGLDIEGQVSTVLVDGRCVFDRSKGGFAAGYKPRA